MRNLTLEELAELSGLSAGYICKLEAENVIRHRTPTLTTLESLSLALSICPRDILWYSCENCKLIETCPKNKVDLNEIIEGNLNFYI